MKFVTEEERWKTVNSHVTEQFYCNSSRGTLRVTPFLSLPLLVDTLKALFTRREGNPVARVTLARELPLQLHISSFFHKLKKKIKI